MSSPENPSYVAVDPKNGLHLRPATDAERVAYLEQPGPGEPGSFRRQAFRKAIRVGDVLIDEYTGPGGSADQGNWAWL